MFILKYIKSPRSKYLLGLLFLLGVVLLWVGSSFLTSYLFQDHAFDRPFFLTYFNTGCFSLYLVIVYSTRLFKKLTDKSTTQVEDASSPLLMEDRTNIEFRYIDDNNIDIENRDAKSSATVKRFSDLQTAKLSLSFCILWFIANWSSNLSISLTSVASSTIISSTSGVFTLILGYFFKIEQFSKIKVLGVLFTLTGVVVIALLDSQSSDTSGSGHTVVGDLVALLGSVFYGLYITFLKLKVDDELVDPQLFLGFVGLINLVILIPVFPIIHYTGFEPFTFPPTTTIWLILLLGALLGTVLSDYLWLYAVLLTSPLVVTLGLSFTIPFSIIGDIFIKGIRPSAYYYIGAACVILGFFGVNYTTVNELRNKPTQEPETMDSTELN